MNVFCASRLAEIHTTIDIDLEVAPFRSTHIRSLGNKSFHLREAGAV